MIKGSDVRKADFPIEQLLLDRWSPRAMSGEEISDDELMRLFEAARWAPSSFMLNSGARSTPGGHRALASFLELLVEANKSWAKNAAVLVLFVSRTTFEYDGEVPRLRTPLIPEQRGKTSRSKVSARDSSSTVWRALTMSARA